MRSQHRGEELHHVARGEYCNVRREGEKTQHPPTHTHIHTSLLLRHHSSMKPTPLSNLILSPSSSSPHPSPTPPVCLPPALSFSMSQKALSTICCRMLQITSVSVHVFERGGERAQKVVIFLHLLCLSHTHLSST